MNTHDLQDLNPTDRAFAQLARSRLRASESLNYMESAKLAATRAQVRESMCQPQPGLPAWSWLAAPALLAALTVLLLQPQLVSAPQTPAPSAEVLIELSADVNATEPAALTWVSDEAGPDFYRDLEFYQWLQSRSPSEPNA